MQTISVGRTVQFILTADQAAQINRRRTTGASIAERLKQEVVDQAGGFASVWPVGAQAHIGNEAKEGDVVPMVVVRHWSGTCVNGQAFLDGNDTLWVTSVSEGTEPGTWQWPARGEAPVESPAVAGGVVVTETSRSRR